MVIAMRSLTLGCAQFGNGYGFYINTPQMSSEEITHILNRATEEGIETLDLAQGYEGVVANLSRIDHVNRFKLGTKIKWANSNKESIFQSLESELRILKSLQFESILIHDWSGLKSTQRESSLTFLGDLRNQGITKFIGVSVYETNELLEINEPIEIIQAPLNYFNNEFLLDDTARNLARSGVAFHARSIFHQGTLLNLSALPTRFLSEVKKYEEFCEYHGLTGLQGALSIFDSQDLFSKLIVGVSSMNQLQEIVQCPVTSINTILDEVPVGVPKELLDPRLWTTT